MIAGIHYYDYYDIKQDGKGLFTERKLKVSWIANR